MKGSLIASVLITSKCVGLPVAEFSTQLCGADQRLSGCFAIRILLLSLFCYPNPVMGKIILSVSENYLKVYYDAQHTFL